MSQAMPAALGVAVAPGKLASMTFGWEQPNSTHQREKGASDDEVEEWAQREEVVWKVTAMQL